MTVTPETINWENLGFEYMDTGKRYRAYYRNGKWEPGQIVTDKMVTIDESSPALHYGQQAFEGMKAYRRQDGQIQLFRPEENAKRLVRSAEQIMMEPYPVDLFVEAVHEVVRANADWVPPYGTGATLYIRPMLIGIGENIGLGPAKEFMFSIFVMPVGPYFKGPGLSPSQFWVSDYDRAAPNGTGGVKVGGNYAGSMLAAKEAKEGGFADAIFLDPATHTKIEEVGAANFFGIDREGRFVTPKSPSILPSITKHSLLWLAEHRLGLEAVEGDVFVGELDQFVEAGAMGTAAVITPISRIVHGESEYTFGNGSEAGPKTQALYDELIGIQFGDRPAPDQWVQVVELNN